MQSQRTILLLLVVLSLIPAYSLHQWLQRVIQPRQSFLRLLLFMAASLVLAFAYTFLLIFFISKMFPLAKG